MQSSTFTAIIFMFIIQKLLLHLPEEKNKNRNKDTNRIQINFKNLLLFST